MLANPLRATGSRFYGPYGGLILVVNLNSNSDGGKSEQLDASWSYNQPMTFHGLVMKVVRLWEGQSLRTRKIS